MPGIVGRTDENAPHCSSHEMAEGSTNWFVDGKGISGYGDSCTGHDTDITIPCPSHQPTATPPDRGWYIDGKNISAIMDGIDGCTSHSKGSSNWFIGG